MIPNGLRPA